MKYLLIGILLSIGLLNSSSIVENIITSGKSITKIAQILQLQNLIVTDIIVFLDREEGGKQYLELLEIQVHSLTTVSKLLTSLKL